MSHRGFFMVWGHYEMVIAFRCSERSLADVVALVIQNFGPDPEFTGETFGDDDLVIWNGGQVVAVVRNGGDGKPVATIFGP